jgi:hypothetical protein
VLSAILALGAAGVPAAEPVLWTFESAETGWRPRSAGVAVNRAEGQDTSGNGTAALRVSGVQQDGWNYAISDTHPLTAGRLYRLSAKVRVERLGEGTPAPYLKCEFVHAEQNRAIGRVNTDPYDIGRLGQWQELACEFRAPTDTVAFWLALEKGGSQRAEIEALLDDVRVEEIPYLTALERYRLEPLPKPLAALRGTHPRLYLGNGRIGTLREAIGSSHARLWAAVRTQADAAVKRGAPRYVERDSYSGDEQLWQREVGNAMPTLAMAWVLTEDPKYLAATRDWALASCGYPTWGLGRIDGMDLATGHQLLGLALVYDWCYEALGEGTRETLRATLVRRTSRMFEAAASGEVWWQRSYLQNHLWVNVCGLAAAGFALFDEVPDAGRWIGLARDRFRTTMASLGPDGASHEGVGYWQYGAEYLLKYMDLAVDLLAEDLFDTAWWRNTATYAQHLSLPRQAWTRSNCIVDIADCPRGNWYGPDHILRRLAREYRDGHAQWLADEIAAAGTDAPSARWLNLLWHDPGVVPEGPADLPTLMHFTDMGLVASRSDWSGKESLLVFKCGPFIGHEAVQRFRYDPGGGHVHPDANHLVVFAHGEWLLRDDGYRAKWTGQHNTLLVDGKGQLGEGHQWFHGGEALSARSQPRMVRAESAPRLDLLVGDATAAYPTSLGLKRYLRHLLYVKPDVLIVLDDIVTEGDRDLELRFHPESKDIIEVGPGNFLAQGTLAKLHLRALTPAGVVSRAGEVAAAGRGEGVSAPMAAVRLTTHRAAWRNATALSWCEADGQPAEVSLQVAAERWGFQIGETHVRFDWRTGSILPE